MLARDFLFSASVAHFYIKYEYFMLPCIASPVAFQIHGVRGF
jgi:hypothetical protein